MYLKNKLNLIVFLFPIFSFIYCLSYSQYIYDGYHFGLILSNAIELNNGKLPYKEIFIEYGYLTTLIHSIILKIFGNEVYYLQVFTSVIYSTTIIIIAFIVKRFTNVYYAIFASVALILVNPIPLKPWPIYISFFLFTISLNFLISNKKSGNFFSGIFLALSYLTFTTVYNFVLVPLLLSILIYYFFSIKKKEKEIHNIRYFFIGSILPIFLFTFYLLKENIFGYWIDYQLLPITFVLEFTNSTAIQRIIYFLNSMSLSAFKNYIVSPYQIFFGLIYFVTIYFIIKGLIHFILNKKTMFNKKEYLLISFYVISLSAHAIIGGIEKLSTSLSLGIIILLIFIYNFKRKEYKYFLFTFLIFTVFLIFMNNYKYPEYSSLIIDRDEKSINQKNINYFKKQKWSQKKWNVVNGIIEHKNKINMKCNINLSANLTNDAFYFVLMDNKLQLVPFFFKKHGNILRELIEPDLIKQIQKKIYGKKIFLIISENNNELFNLNDYLVVKKYDIDEKNLKLNFIYLMVPDYCFEKISS